MKKIGEIFPYVLLSILGLLLVQARCDISGLHDTIENLPQAKPYQLPDDVVMMAELDKNVLSIIQREGGDSTYVINHYIPAESSIEYITQVDTVALGRLEEAYILLHHLEAAVETASDSARVDSLRVAIQNIERDLYNIGIEYDTHGFCFVPEVGASVDTDFNANIEGGARLYYINRFGLGIHGAVEIPTDSTEGWDGSVGLFGDWRVPNFDNVAIFGSVDYDFPEKKVKGMLGAHIYLR